MKNLYNTCKVSIKSLRIVILGFLASVLFGPSAFANSWYTASEITLQKDNDSQHYIRMHDKYTSHDAGTLTKLWITGYRGWITMDTNDFNSGDGTLYNSVYNVTTKTFGTWNDSWSDTYNFSGWYEEGGKNIQRLDFYPSNVHDFNVAPSTPGSYQFQAKIKKKSNSTWWLESPTGSNYVVSFRVPGFTNTSVTHNVTVNKVQPENFLCRTHILEIMHLPVCLQQFPAALHQISRITAMFHGDPRTDQEGAVPAEGQDKVRILRIGVSILKAGYHNPVGCKKRLRGPCHLHGFRFVRIHDQTDLPEQSGIAPLF